MVYDVSVWLGLDGDETTQFTSNERNLTWQ